MESVYESSLLHLEKMTKPSPYLIELIAALERALVFAWTGNPKVLERTVGNDLFVTLGLIKHGFPMINSSIVGLARRAGQEHRIFPSYWPMRLPGPQPAMSSTRSQILTWGKQQLAVRGCHIYSTGTASSHNFRTALHNAVRKIYCLLHSHIRAISC